MREADLNQEMDENEAIMEDWARTLLRLPYAQPSDFVIYWGHGIVTNATTCHNMSKTDGMVTYLLTDEEISSLEHRTLLSTNNIKLYSNEQLFQLAICKWGGNLRLAQVRSIHNREARQLLKEDRARNIV